MKQDKIKSVTVVFENLDSIKIKSKHIKCLEMNFKNKSTTYFTLSSNKSVLINNSVNDENTMTHFLMIVDLDNNKKYSYLDLQRNDIAQISLNYSEKSTINDINYVPYYSNCNENFDNKLSTYLKHNNELGIVISKKLSKKKREKCLQEYLNNDIIE